MIALTQAINVNNNWTYTPYLTADYVKKNNADVEKTTLGYIRRESETSEAAVEAGYETTKYNSTFSAGEALSPSKMRRIAIEEANERETDELKASQAASDKAKADELKADSEKEGKGEAVVAKREIPPSAKAP